MRFLLDTHIWIWSQLEPCRVTSDVNLALESPENELWLSPISIWELVLLLEKKRIDLGEELHLWISNAQRDLMLREAPFSWEVAQELRITSLGHKDPADRLLVATARVHDLTLVTADTRLMRVDRIRVLANR